MFHLLESSPPTSGASSWKEPSWKSDSSLVTTTLPTQVSSPPKCLHCEKTFVQKQSLYRHMQIIHGVKPDLQKGQFPCEKCDEKFTQKYNLYRHMRKQHGVEPDISKSSFLCPTCRRPFIRKAQRDKHAKCHEKEKIHLCKYCETAFFSYSNYKLHKRSCSANTSREPTL